jgi:plastocyanin
LGCERISGEENIIVSAGQRYAKDIPGTIYGMNQHEWDVDPCTRVTVTFINEDDVRHQWMVHGLPKYLYPAGMFHIEAMGGKTTTGTFIVPSEDRNYLVHCDMTQHMEMGMRGQLVVGEGSGDLWAVTGITDPFYRASYLPDNLIYLSLVVLFLGYSVTSWLVRMRQKR